jgi:hypothetical protein
MIVGVTHFKDTGEAYTSNEFYVNPSEITYNTFIK